LVYAAATANNRACAALLDFRNMKAEAFLEKHATSG
jgi:hypothetical protein